MIDHLTLGSAPSDEVCAQVGSEDYTKKMRIESRVYKNQITREFVIHHNRRHECTLQTKSFPHDFGSYHEVCAVYDNSNQMKDALWIEGHSPEKWDGESRKELEQAGYVLEESL